jgi:hypothetical protein
VVDIMTKDLFNISTEGCIVDKTVSNAILTQKLSNLTFLELEVKSTKAGSKSCFSDNSLSEFVKINKELLDSDSVFGATCLEVLFNIKLNIHDCHGVLLSTGMERVDH